MQNEFDNINLYEVKASINNRQTDETFMIGGRNINDAINTAEKYIKETYDEYGCGDIEILTICVSRKNIVINKNEI